VPAYASGDASRRPAAEALLVSPSRSSRTPSQPIQPVRGLLLPRCVLPWWWASRRSPIPRAGRPPCLLSHTPTHQPCYPSC